MPVLKSRPPGAEILPGGATAPVIGCWLLAHLEGLTGLKSVARAAEIARAARLVDAARYLEAVAVVAAGLAAQRALERLVGR